MGEATQGCIRVGQEAEGSSRGGSRRWARAFIVVLARTIRSGRESMLRTD